jgi:methylase of polypeptide subunit release factors
MAELRLCIQGHWLSLKAVQGVEPTPFSLFVANMLTLRSTDRVAIDAGAGGGILSIALVRLGAEYVTGIDRNERACQVFEENIRRHDMVSRVNVVHGDIADYTPERPADLVVANPPTLPEHDGLPEFVRGGGPDGMAFLRLLLARSRDWLTPAGELQFVVSSLVEWSELEKLATEHRWSLEGRGSVLVPIRSVYQAAYGTGSDGALQVPGGAPDGRVFHESEIVTVYFGHRKTDG